jgi:hypothetical protein
MRGASTSERGKVPFFHSREEREAKRRTGCAGVPGEHAQAQVGEDGEAGAEVRVVARRVCAAVDQDGGRLRLQHHDVRLRRPRLDYAPVVASAPIIIVIASHYHSCLKNVSSRVPPCLTEGTLSCRSRLHLQSLAPTNPHWARVVDYGSFSFV